MGLEYRNFWRLASKEELKKRHAQLKKVPKTKNSYYFPHNAFLGDFRESEEEILFFPHDKDTEVKYVDADDRDGPLSVRHLTERTDFGEKYSEALESENMRDMAELLEMCGTPIPSKYTTVKFTQNQRKVKVSAGKGDKKVKLEYSKVSVLVEKAPHGRGTAGSLREDWISVSARGPSEGVKSLVAELRANCKTLSATEMPDAGSSSSSSTGPFPTYIESGYAEFVSRMAARVKPPSIPMTKRKGRDVEEGEADDAVDKKEDGPGKKQKKERRNSAVGAAAGLAAGLAGVVKGAGAAVAAAVGMSKGSAGSSKAKEIQKTLDKINANLKGTALAESSDDDSDDEPILNLLPAKKKPGPKSKKEKEAMAAKAAAEAGKKATATTATADAPKKERKKPGPKTKKEKEEMAAKAAAEEAAKAAKRARRADSSGTDADSDSSDSDDDMPLAAMI